MSGLRCNVSDILHRPGARRHETIEARLDGPAILGTNFSNDQPFVFDVTFEHVEDGVVVHGLVSGGWSAPCSRCLEQLGAHIEVAIHEFFEPNSIDGETYPIVDGEIDLEPILLDALLPEMPLAPRCSESCLGLCPHCGINRNLESCDCAQRVIDPRWAALDVLKNPIESN